MNKENINGDQTPIERLKEMQEAGKIDVVFELERILGEEFRSAIIDSIKEKDWLQYQKDQILSYKFKGKTILEWEILAKEVNGVSENGTPNWYEPHTNMMDGFTLAKLLYLTEEQLKEEGGEESTHREFNNSKLNFIANSLKERAVQIQYVGDVSDLGNEIGVIVGHAYENMSEEEIEDFITGLRHGISLTNGTHGK